MNRFVTIMAALALTGTPAALAQKKPADIHLTSKSKEGAVLIRVPAQPFPYALQFSKNGNSGFMSRVYLMKVQPGASGYTYIARTLAPGRYRLDNVWQQSAWTVCLEQGTVEFTVEAGKIAYLGTFEVDAVLREIQSQAVATGKTEVRNLDYMQGQSTVSEQMFSGRDAAGLAGAQAFAQTGMNGSGALVGLADVAGTSFSTSSFGKAIKICG